jgi:monoamine oxidase
MSRSMYDKLYRRFGETLPDTKVSAQAEALIDIDQKLWTSSLTADCRAKLGKIRVAVVGGGFAGMMAAWWLCRTEKTIEVVVFEAGAEVGGRVWSNESFTKGTRTIEFGAELVGANHPHWLETAREFGIGLLTRTGESDYGILGLTMKMRVDGKDLSDKDAKQMTDEMKAIFIAIGKDASRVKDPAQPWTDAGLQHFDNMSVDDKLLKPAPDGLGLTPRKLGYRGVQMQLENNLLTPISKINYLGLLCLVKAGRFGSDKDGEDKDLLGFWEQTEAFRCSDGCQVLLKRMVTKLGDTKEFKFTLLNNTEVTNIETDSFDPPKPVKLQWKSTAAVKRVDPGFDFVILAVPPSVWDKIKITPQHPKDAGPIQTGGAIKFFSNLKDRFWILEGAAPSGISSDLGMIWEGTDNQVQVGNAEIELSVFAGGPAIAGRDVPYYKRKLGELYPGYRASNAGKKTELVDWPSRKFIETGYSCPRLGHMFTVAPVLQKPFGERLFLAGEHTQTDFFGFMEGALRSGRRAATAIISKVCPGSFPDFPNA